MEQARAVMEGTMDSLLEVEDIKKAVARKATLKVNAMMAQVTLLMTEAVVSQLEKDIDSTLGNESKNMAEVRAIGAKLEEKGKKMEEMKKQGKGQEFRALNKEFIVLLGKAGTKMEEMEDQQVMVGVNMDLEKIAQEVI